MSSFILSAWSSVSVASLVVQTQPLGQNPLKLMTESEHDVTQDIWKPYIMPLACSSGA